MATYHLSVKTGSRGAASQHMKYIAREGGYMYRGEDLVACEHLNLPTWAQDEPKVFWKAADKYERKNGAVYREYEAALPAELTTEQQKELARAWLNQVAPGKVATLAIHAPSAALGGVPQPHFHVMVSDRMMDGIDRSPEQHFRRYNPKNPALGGCRKDSGGKTPIALRNELKETRKAWADLTNEHLELHGHVARVDHRSHKDRGLEATPGKHLGAARVRKLQQSQAGADCSERADIQKGGARQGRRENLD